MHKKPYLSKLLDPRWQQLRLRVFERDNWTCRGCQAKEKTLHAHHIHYHPLADGPWDYDLSALITLCADCHEQEHLGLDAAKANLLLALAQKGIVLSNDFECLTVQVEQGGRI